MVVLHITTRNRTSDVAIPMHAPETGVTSESFKLPGSGSVVLLFLRIQSK